MRSLRAVASRYRSLTDERSTGRRVPPDANAVPRPVTPPNTRGTPAILAAMAPYTLGLTVKCWASRSETTVDRDEVNERPELRKRVQAPAVEVPGDEFDSHALDVGHEAAWGGDGVHSDAVLQELPHDGGAEAIDIGVGVRDYGDGGGEVVTRVHALFQSRSTGQ